MGLFDAISRVSKQVVEKIGEEAEEIQQKFKKRRAKTEVVVTKGRPTLRPKQKRKVRLVGRGDVPSVTEQRPTRPVEQQVAEQIETKAKSVQQVSAAQKRLDVEIKKSEQVREKASEVEKGAQIEKKKVTQQIKQVVALTKDDFVKISFTNPETGKTETGTFDRESALMKLKAIRKQIERQGTQAEMALVSVTKFQRKAGKAQRKIDKTKEQISEERKKPITIQRDPSLAQRALGFVSAPGTAVQTILSPKAGAKAAAEKIARAKRRPTAQETMMPKTVFQAKREKDIFEGFQQKRSFKVAETAAGVAAAVTDVATFSLVPGAGAVAATALGAELIARPKKTAKGTGEFLKTPRGIAGLALGGVLTGRGIAKARGASAKAKAPLDILLREEVITKGKVGKGQFVTTEGIFDVKVLGKEVGRGTLKGKAVAGKKISTFDVIKTDMEILGVKEAKVRPAAGVSKGVIGKVGKTVTEIDFFESAGAATIEELTGGLTKAEGISRTATGKEITDLGFISKDVLKAKKPGVEVTGTVLAGETAKGRGVFAKRLVRDVTQPLDFTIEADIFAKDVGIPGKTTKVKPVEIIKTKEILTPEVTGQQLSELAKKAETILEKSIAKDLTMAKTKVGTGLSSTLPKLDVPKTDTAILGISAQKDLSMSELSAPVTELGLTGKIDIKESIGISPVSSQEIIKSNALGLDLDIKPTVLSGVDLDIGLPGKRGVTTIGKTKTKSRLRERATRKTDLSFGRAPVFRSFLDSAIGLRVGQKQDIITQLRIKTDTFSNTELGISSPTLLGLPTVFGPPTGRGFPPIFPPKKKLFGLGRGGRIGEKSPFGEDQFVTPSLTALAFDIRGPKPTKKEFTGFEERPIFAKSGRRKKGKRKSKGMFDLTLDIGDIGI